MQRIQINFKMSVLAIIFLVVLVTFMCTTINFTISKFDRLTEKTKAILYTAINSLEEAKKNTESTNQKINKMISLQQVNKRVDRNLTLKDIDLMKELYTLTHITLDSVTKYNQVYKLLIIVSSHSRNNWRRRWIRSLWGNRTIWSEKNWRIVFVTGQEDDKEVMLTLAEEAEKYKDILIEDIAEDFYQLAKKIIIGLTWSMHNINFEYILKIDDDVFVNIDNAFQFLNINTNMEGYYGNVVVHNLVERIGRYGVSKKEHLADYYSPYCSGGGFIMTKATVAEILPFFDFTRVFKIDDAYVGETAMRAGISATHVVGFYMSNTWCEFKENIIVSHPTNEHKCMKFLTNRSTIHNVR
ncbi:N-acetyllactosaminide beta-1,3-N-acetylglucosaminyltransferase 4 [Hydra vulgaris]|uniref:Hexosyltransferase n=1 Tax=Hydra vulgaris TaxID=6087 RepID=A0ABM4C9N5_HYDVU